MRPRPRSITVCSGVVSAFALGLTSVLLLAIASTIAPAPAPVAAQSGAGAELAPSRDNTLYEDATGSRSNGSGAHFFAGRTGSGGRRRAVMAFDVADRVPTGVQIVSATLELHVSRQHSGAQTVALHRLQADWGEGASNASVNEGGGAEAAQGDATWLHTFFGSDRRWATPGGDFNATASATEVVDAAGSYVWGSTPAMVADVQGWLDAPDTCFGWLLMGNESRSGTSKRFDSRENDAPNARPVLRVAWGSDEVKFYNFLPTLERR